MHSPKIIKDLKKFGEKIIKKDLREAILKKKGKKEIERIVEKKKSLTLIRSIGKNGGEYYVYNTNARSGLAWFWLGGWRGQTVREKMHKKCPLCGKADSEWHVVGGCGYLENLRKKMNIRVERWNWKNWLKMKDKRALTKIGIYLSKVRQLRNVK